MAKLFFGRNSMGTIDLFLERKNYKNSVLNKQNVLESWQEEGYLYGRLDLENNVVIPSEAFFKQIKSQRKTLYAMNFVVNAFSDLQEHYELAYARKKLARNKTILDKIEPHKSWDAIHDKYHSHANFVYQLFLLTRLENFEIRSRIRNFDDFLKEFFLFIVSDENDLVFTRSTFIASNDCSSSVSGLVIDLQPASIFDNDEEKERWLTDPNFKFYHSSIQRFGFRIDKNAPWRIIADINSPVMKKYIRESGTLFEKMFDDYFYKAYETDIIFMKVYLRQFYNSFISSWPNYKKNFKSNPSPRKPLSEENMNKIYSNIFWIKTYIKFKIFENTANTENAHLFSERLTSDALMVYDSLGWEMALNIVNAQTKHFTSKKPEFSFSVQKENKILKRKKKTVKQLSQNWPADVYPEPSIGGLLLASLLQDGIITPAALTGDVNDYDPGLLADTAVLRIDPGASSRQITGIDPGAFPDNGLLLIVNIGTTDTADLQLKHESVSSLAANRFDGKSGGTHVITTGAFRLLWRDGTSNIWRILFAQ